MKYKPHEHPRDQIVAIMERIYAHEMTTTSGDAYNYPKATYF